MLDLKPILAIRTGDPAGVGPEISLQAQAEAEVRGLCRPLLLGNGDILERARQLCGSHFLSRNRTARSR